MLKPRNTRFKGRITAVLSRKNLNKYMKNEDKNRENTPKILRIKRFLGDKYDLRVNVITNQIEARKKGKGDFEQFNESNLLFELYEKGFTKPKEEFKVLISSDQIKRFDPFSEYFNSLPKWDTSQPDYIGILASYVKTDDDVFWKKMFSKHLIRTVAQAIGKGSFNKQCLTFVGKQNDGKTMFFDFLVPRCLNNYYGKHFEFGSKEGKISLTQNFLINLDELASFEKKELNNDFKSVLSENIVRYRPNYSNYETTFRRRASFVATTNQFEFLTDETGNVRWVPFVVTEIIHDRGGPKGYSANVDINQVWAQAYYLLLQGETGQLNVEEIDQLERSNKRFVRSSLEMEIVATYLKPAKKQVAAAEFMQAYQVETYLKEKEPHIKLYTNRIGKALTSLGFDKVQRRVNGSPTKGYLVVKTNSALNTSRRKL